MACFSPLAGQYTGRLTAAGKREIVFINRVDVPGRSLNDPSYVDLPCGKCAGCRLSRSRDWMVRCVHESSLFLSNCFVTLTFRAADLPWNGSLDVRHLQLFMKRLRKFASSNTAGDCIPAESGSRKVRFFACGEYGEGYSRPHYHVLLFNFDFKDKTFFKMSGESRLYESRTLSGLWPFGFALIGDVNEKSAAYVAGYIHKKRKGDGDGGGYRIVDPATGEIVGERKREFVVMSRRPGIGSDWIRRFRRESYARGGGSVVMKGREVRPPRYYDKYLEEVDVDRFARVQDERRRSAAAQRLEGSDARLEVRARVAKDKMALNRRKLENGTESI